MAERAVVVWLGSCNDISCSGIILDFNRGLVLTTGSLFREYIDIKCLAEGKSVFYWQPASVSPKVQTKDGKVKDRTKDPYHIGVQVLLKNHSQPKDENTFVKQNLLEGRVIILWQDKNISKLLNEIFPVSDWDFKDNQEMESEIKKIAFTSVTDNLQTEMRQKSESDVSSIFLSVFAVIHVPDLKRVAALNTISKSFLSPLSESITSLSRVLKNLPTPQVGDPVKIIGTPFGFECPSVFFNCVSKGIISNLAGSNSELILTDARAAPGSEGSPLYLESACSDGNSMLLGVVLAPFCWRNGEWIGITLACAVKQVLNSLHTLLLQSGYGSGDGIFAYLMLQISDMNRDSKATEKDLVLLRLNKQKLPVDSIVDKSHSFSQQFIAGKELHRLLESVVLVESGTSWGSGVIINSDEGLVLSCSHVVRESTHLASLNNCKSDAYTVNRGNKTCMIRTGAPDFTWHEAKILFSTSPESAIDLSLLKVERKSDFLKDLKSSQGILKNVPFSSSSDYHFLNLNVMKKGDPIVVVGYPMFGSGDLKIGPSVTAGVLSNVVYVDGQVIMLQTTAAVHCGASGGAVFSTQTGEFLGLVTCNTKDANTSASFPHINFAVPLGLINQFLQKVLQSSVSQSLQIFVPPGTQDIWTLKKTPLFSHI